MSTIHVILSTYNGMPYIAEQVSSILNQKNVHIKLWIRDDGSTDGTYEYVKSLKNVANLQEDKLGRLGTTGSLLQLIQTIKDSDFLAFADQDDIWEPSHLENAVLTLNCSGPAIYFPRYRIINDNTQDSFILMPANTISVANALVENPIIGCGIVMNKSSVDLIRNLKISSNTFLDWQLYFLIGATGKIFQGTKVGVNYRLHKNNLVGFKQKSFWKNMLNIRGFINRIKMANDSFEQLFYQTHSLMEKNLSRKLQSYFKLRNKSFLLKIFLNNQFYFKRSRFSHQIIFVLLFIFVGF